MAGFRKAIPVFNRDFGLVYMYGNGAMIQRCDGCQGILRFKKGTRLWTCQKCGRVTNNVHWSPDEAPKEAVK